MSDLDFEFELTDGNGHKVAVQVPENGGHVFVGTRTAFEGDPMLSGPYLEPEQVLDLIENLDEAYWAAHNNLEQPDDDDVDEIIVVNGVTYQRVYEF